MHQLNKLTQAFTFSFVLSLLTMSIAAQAPVAKPGDAEKIEKALMRAKKGAEIINAVAALPEGKGIPKEIMSKAKVVGVIPNVLRLSLLVSSGTKGYGVLSSRQAVGWSMPAYYRFARQDFHLPKVKGKHFDLIMVFVEPNSVAELSSKSKNTSDSAAASGPLETRSPESDKKLRKADVLFYTFIDGVLAGLDDVDKYPGDGFIEQDNNINKAVYGVKASDIITGKVGAPVVEAAGIAAFRDALNSKYP